MFKSARIKLTLWYLLIIMLISFSFSGVIYFRSTQELERGLRRMEIRHRAEDLKIPLPRFFSLKPEELPPRLRNSLPKYFFVEDIQEVKKRLLFNLLATNLGIFCVAGFSGWFLAGKTLQPIEKVLEEQKRFIADASHELKTPLTSLKTSLEVTLRNPKLNLTEAKETIKEGLDDVNSLVALTEKLLKLSRLETNGNHSLFEKVSLKELVENAVAKVTPLARKKKISLKVETKDLFLWGEKDSLIEMLTIFLDNAIKYNKKQGKVFLQTTKEKNNVVIKITDTGIGISEKDLPHIFERFYRADQSRSKDKTPGFGLGLALAKSIIEKHSGTVAVLSRLGEGTSFTITLPLKK